MDVCIHFLLVDPRGLTLVSADDLGVIAEVIACGSFISRFNLNDTESWVAISC